LQPVGANYLVAGSVFYDQVIAYRIELILIAAVTPRKCQTLTQLHIEDLKPQSARSFAFYAIRSKPNMVLSQFD
jgi:hypothetical protein